VATHGAGRLEVIDGTKVLFVKGTPEEMGEQHGRLLKKEIHDVLNRILYGIGVGSSFTKGRWFFGENRVRPSSAQSVHRRALSARDGFARAGGRGREGGGAPGQFLPRTLPLQRVCAVRRRDRRGRMFHGRVLDYMKGVGLEQNAVVMVFQPDQRNAWVNISYAGLSGRLRR